jgi:hypothetical protein
MKNILIFITFILLTSISTSSLAESGQLDLRDLGLNIEITRDGCFDKNNQRYDYRSILPIFEKGFHYILMCESEHHRYQWEVKAVKKSLYSNKVYTDGLGCRDIDSRIYDTNVNIPENISYSRFSKTFIYTCREKNGNHYFIIE